MITLVFTFLVWPIFLAVVLTTAGTLPALATYWPEQILNISVGSLAEFGGYQPRWVMVALILVVFAPALFYSFRPWWVELIRFPVALLSATALGVLIKELPVAIVPNRNVMLVAYVSAFIAAWFYKGIRGNDERVSLWRASAAHAIVIGTMVAIAVAAMHVDTVTVQNSVRAAVVVALGYPLAWRAATPSPSSPVSRAMEAIVMSSCLLLLLAFVVTRRLKRAL